MRGRSFLQGPAAAPVWKILLCLLPLGIQEPDPQRADRAVYRARHILIPWKESAGAGATTTRTKAEAKKLADELHARIRAGESFAELAMKHSSDPSRLDGGDLGQFRPKEIYGFFVEWIKKARPGALLPLKESRFGYHIVERLAVQNPWPDLVAASHIMIAHSGARGAPKSVRRSREEARLIAG
ncbi:MAG: peptidylprolyl isomerase, partial [Planctomycetota bacterium]